MSEPLPKLSEQDLHNIAKVLFHGSFDAVEPFFVHREILSAGDNAAWEVVDAEGDQLTTSWTEDEALQTASALNRLARYGNV